jgi:tetratricopeptide (TPR) repeat protein
MKAINALRICAALLGLLAIARPAQSAGWWRYEWKVRRPVTLSAAQPSGLPGDDVAVVTFPTGRWIAADGLDLRVTTASMREVPSRVLMTGPGDVARVAFAVQPGVTSYFVYFGNRQAEKSTEELTIQRGLLMSTWRYPGGGAGNLEQVRAVFERADTLFGRDFRNRLFLGHNPFGFDQRVASLFEGYLVCPERGRYVFATSSRNSSMLLIDDRLVVDNGGMHEPQDDIRKRGGVELAAGLHKLTLYHVSFNGDPVVVAAWRPPGQTRVQVIPPSAFAPVAEAQAGYMEELGKVGVDFLYDHAGEAFAKNRYFERFRFRGAIAGGKATVRRWRWLFGDGTTGEGADVEHVFLRPGTYNVTLTASTPAGVLKQSHRLVVARPWDRVIDHRLDSLEVHAALVSDYDFTSLRGSALLEAAWLLERAGLSESLLALGKACRTRAAQGEKSAARVLPIYARILVQNGRAGDAAEALEAGMARMDDPSLSARLLVEAGRIRLDHLRQTDAAEALFQRVTRECAPLTTSQAVREAKIGIGDVWRFRGDRERAMTAYLAAGRGAVKPSGSAALARGDFGRRVEEYLRRADLASAREALEQWIEAFPEDRLEGYSSLLMVRLLIAEGRLAEGVGEAETLVRVSPTSHHAPSLLMLAAEGHRRAGQESASQGALRRVVEEYPESTLAAKARALLAQ